MNTLEINGLSKSYQQLEVIKGLSLSVKKGEFVSILGPSGSGKSTLFHLLGGIISPDKGSIYLNDEEITGEKGHISYMPQQPSLLPWRTILKNVLIGQELYGKKDIEKAKNMLERAGLKGYENAYPSELSGGMKQRAAFVRALLSPQSLLCLDEPFSALDEFTRMEMQKWLLSMWEENQPSVLFVTHNIEEAIFLSDRIVILSEKPAKIIAEFKIPLTRPRREQMVLNEIFLHLKREIYNKMRIPSYEQNH